MIRFASLLICLCLFMSFIACSNAQNQKMPFLKEDPHNGLLSLTQAGASHFAKLALKCVDQEYPNKLSHVMNDSSEVQSPSALHPAFYGCFDWHSSVHGHWMLVSLLKRFPDMPEANEIRQKLAANLTADNIAIEVSYLHQPNRKSFERTYGWAWLLKLADELQSWEDTQGQQWATNLQPLADEIVTRYLNFLPRLNYPIRSGEHPNTAFGLSFAYDYAVNTENIALQQLIEGTALRFYAKDQNCPLNYEPGGSDFLSPCLEEADLMWRILPQDEYVSWLQNFLPGIPDNPPLSIQAPATVSDRSDGKLVHLDGLNLSRAWCMQQIAEALPANAPSRKWLLAQAKDHINTTLPNIASGSYEGEHWLASFAVYALSVADK
ncbi:MAG: DUF2891 domain-containing protein [Bacteroidota bacterium]